MRLFIAINLPAAEREALAEATRPLRSATLPVRWSEASALHLTLRFLGEVPEVQATSLAANLATAVRSARPFDLALGGIGAFPALARPRVVWCGVERHPALELLANDVEHMLMAAGFAPEIRPFHPHITLGRVRRDARPDAFDALASLAESVDYATVIPVASVDLMQSVAGADGTVYTEIGRAPLEGGQ